MAYWKLDLITKKLDRFRSVDCAITGATLVSEVVGYEFWEVDLISPDGPARVRFVLHTQYCNMRVLSGRV